MAREAFERGYQLARREEDAWGMGSCLHCLGHLAKVDGDPKRARAYFEESVHILRECGDVWNLTHPLTDIAMSSWEEGRVQESWDICIENLSAFESLGSKFGAAWIQRQLGATAMWMGKTDAATDLLERSFAYTHERGNISGTALATGYLGINALFQKNFSAARAHLETSVRLNRETDNQNNIAWALSNLGWLHYHASRLDDALAALDESLSIFERISNAECTDHSLACLARADLARAQGDLDSARGLYQKSLGLTETLPLLPYPLEGFVKLNILLSQADRAARLFAAAHALRQQMEIPLPPVECADYEKHLTMTKRALGKKGFTSAWKEGQGMSVEDVSAYAVGEE